MKDSLTTSYFIRMGVADQGIPIYSDLEFDDPEEGKAMMERAYDRGEINGWTLYKVTRTVRYERLEGDGEEDK